MDDEDLALDVLELYLQRLSGFQVSKRCNDVFEATEYLKCHPADVVFLDIQMPGINGMEWLKGLEYKPLVIFCTAFDQFALESYDVEAIDYLLKPFSFERFEKSTLKLKEKLFGRASSAEKEEFINIRSERKTFRIAVDDILYIHSLSNYYKIVTTNKKIIAYGSLASLEKEFPKERFIRIHRSYLVAKNKIQAFSGNVVVLPNGNLPVGRKYRDAVEKLYE